MTSSVFDRGSGGAGTGASVTPTDGMFLVGDGASFVGESGATMRASAGMALLENALPAPADSNLLVGDGTTWVLESGDTLRTSILGAIGPDLTTVGAAVAADTFLSSTGAGVLRWSTATQAIASLGMDADIATLALPASTTISAFGASMIDDTDEATFKATVNLEIGTDVQAWDAQLDDIAVLSVTNSNFIVGNGDNWVAESGATVRASLGLTIGTHVQAWDAQLDDIAGLSETKGMLISNSTSAYVALAVGANTEVLTADSAEVSGMKWSAAAGVVADSIGLAEIKDDVAGDEGAPFVKAWVSYQQVTTPAILDSYNVSSVTDVSAGLMDVVWDTDFGSINYSAAFMSQSPATNDDHGGCYVQGDNPTVTDLPIVSRVLSATGFKQDANFNHILAVGDR